MYGDTRLNTGAKPLPAGFRKFPGMVDVNRQTQGPVPLKEGNGFTANPAGIRNGKAGAHPEQYPRPRIPEQFKQLFQAPIVRRQGVPAGNKDLPDFRVIPEIAQDGGKFRSLCGTPAGGKRPFRPDEGRA
jgi:hypothetical protein